MKRTLKVGLPLILVASMVVGVGCGKQESASKVASNPAGVEGGSPVPGPSTRPQGGDKIIPGPEANKDDLARLGMSEKEVSYLENRRAYLAAKDAGLMMVGGPFAAIATLDPEALAKLAALMSEATSTGANKLAETLYINKARENYSLAKEVLTTTRLQHDHVMLREFDEKMAQLNKDLGIYEEILTNPKATDQSAARFIEKNGDFNQRKIKLLQDLYAGDDVVRNEIVTRYERISNVANGTGGTSVREALKKNAEKSFNEYFEQMVKAKKDALEIAWENLHRSQSYWGQVDYQARAIEARSRIIAEVDVLSSLGTSRRLAAAEMNLQNTKRILSEACDSFFSKVAKNGVAFAEWLREGGKSVTLADSSIAPFIEDLKTVGKATQREATMFGIRVLGLIGTGVIVVEINNDLKELREIDGKLVLQRHKN